MVEILLTQLRQTELVVTRLSQKDRHVALLQTAANMLEVSGCSQSESESEKFTSKRGRDRAQLTF
jgi:hypothetical protein